MYLLCEEFFSFKIQLPICSLSLSYSLKEKSLQDKEDGQPKEYYKETGTILALDSIGMGSTKHTHAHTQICTYTHTVRDPGIEAYTYAQQLLNNGSVFYQTLENGFSTFHQDNLRRTSLLNKAENLKVKLTFLMPT